MDVITIEGLINDLETLKQKLPEIQEIIKTIAIDEFDKNFEREAFFDKKWPERKKPSEYVLNRRKDEGYKLLFRSGFMRNSLNARIEGDKIVIYSLAEYAKIHNEGGTIRHPGGTAYYYDKKRQKIVFVRNITVAMSNREYRRTQAHEIKIPKRQFAGWHPQLQREIEKQIENLINGIFK